MKRNRLVLGAAVVALAGAVFVSTLSAGTQNGTLTVTASVAANCTITAGTLAFGAYDPIVANLAANLDQTGSFSVKCTKSGTNMYVTADNGANASAGQRRMKNVAGDFLPYLMFTDSGRSTAWGTTQAAGIAVAGNGNTSVPLTIYGRIAAAQDVPVGSYTDTVTMTVNF